MQGITIICLDVLKLHWKSFGNRSPVTTRWWEMKPVYQAAPLLCMPKKNRKLWTVVDARKRNNNTFKDVTPFPDQDQIHMDVAWSKYQTKINMSDTYEQIQIEMDDVWKTTFASPFGTFVSSCNRVIAMHPPHSNVSWLGYSETISDSSCEYI